MKAVIAVATALSLSLCYRCCCCNAYLWSHRNCDGIGQHIHTLQHKCTHFRSKAYILSVPTAGSDLAGGAYTQNCWQSEHFV